MTQKKIFVEYDYFALLSNLNRYGYLEWGMIKEITEYYRLLKLTELYRERYFNPPAVLNNFDDQLKQWTNASFEDYEKGINSLFTEKSIEEDTYKKLREIAVPKVSELAILSTSLKIIGGVILVALFIVISWHFFLHINYFWFHERVFHNFKDFPRL